MAALGMIEVYGFTTSIIVADVCAKAADVQIVAIDRNKPANADKCAVPLLMVVKFEGTPAAVQAARESVRSVFANADAAVVRCADDVPDCIAGLLAALR